MKEGMKEPKYLTLSSFLLSSSIHKDSRVMKESGLSLTLPFINTLKEWREGKDAALLHSTSYTHFHPVYP